MIMAQASFLIDGSDFDTLEGFLQAFTDELIPGAVRGWIHNLDAFNDFLYRGDEKPPDGFTLVWKNSDLSRTKLGYGETVRQLERGFSKCHPLNKGIIQARIELARQQKGSTIFDEIVEIIRGHSDIQLILS